MKSMIGKKKENILPTKKQVYITLKTQEEVNQLFAMLNYVPIAEVLNVENSDWANLRDNLPKDVDYIDWHRRLGGD